MAQALGLKIRNSVGGDCGKYSVLGTGVTNHYAGVVEGQVRFQLGPNVVFEVRGMRVLDHPHPLFLLGSDILRGGRAGTEWNFEWLANTMVGLG